MPLRKNTIAGASGPVHIRTIGIGLPLATVGSGIGTTGWEEQQEAGSDCGGQEARSVVTQAVGDG